MADDCALDTEKYSLLEDFNVDVEVEKQEFETFSLCFWVYLLDSTTYPSTIIRQVRKFQPLGKGWIFFELLLNVFFLFSGSLRHEFQCAFSCPR